MHPSTSLLDRNNPAVEPRIIVRNDHIEIKFQTSSQALIPVMVDDHATAQRLLRAGRWYLYPSGPTAKYLRRSIRIEKTIITEYAHNFLFQSLTHDNTISDFPARQKKIRPLDGNYLNLRSSNFRGRKPRTDAEVSRYLNLLGGGVFKDMQKKAKRALEDEIKANEVVSSTLERVVDDLRAGYGSFADDQKFLAWVFKLLEVEIRKQGAWRGDVILDEKERSFRSMANIESLTRGSSETSREAYDQEQVDSFQYIGTLSRIPLSGDQNLEWQETAAILLTAKEEQGAVAA